MCGASNRINKHTSGFHNRLGFVLNKVIEVALIMGHVVNCFVRRVDKASLLCGCEREDEMD